MNNLLWFWLHSIYLNLGGGIEERDSNTLSVSDFPRGFYFTTVKCLKKPRTNMIDPCRKNCQWIKEYLFAYFWSEECFCQQITATILPSRFRKKLNNGNWSNYFSVKQNTDFCYFQLIFIPLKSIWKGEKTSLIVFLLSLSINIVFWEEFIIWHLGSGFFLLVLTVQAILFL